MSSHSVSLSSSLSSSSSSSSCSSSSSSSSASSLSSSASTVSPAACTSAPNFLSLLPSALIPLVCVHLTPSEKSSLWSRLCRSHRSQLTSQCFQQDHLHLTPAVLDSLLSSPYLAGLLSHCLSLTIRLSYNEVQPPNFPQQLIQFFNPLPPQPVPNPATHPAPPPPPFPFPHLTHLSLHEDGDTGVVPAILSHPNFPHSLHQLHVLYRSYQHPLPPFLAFTFPLLAELSLPSTLTTSNVRAIMRLPSLRVLDLCQASVVNGQGVDEDDMEGGWVSAVRAAGGVGQQLEVLLMPRGGGQIDDVLKLMHSQVKMEPMEAAETEDKKDQAKEANEKNEEELKDSEGSEQQEGRAADDEVEGERWDIEVIGSTTDKQPSSGDEEKEKSESDEERKEEAAAAAEAPEEAEVKEAASSIENVADAESTAHEEIESVEDTAATEASAEEAIPDAPPLDADIVFLPQRLALFGGAAQLPPPVGRYPELEEKQKAEEALAQQLKRAATPPASATGRRKKPITIPSQIRYLSISGQLSVAGVHSLIRLSQLHSLLFDFYQMSSIGDVFEAFVECAKDGFSQLRVLRLCDWSDEQVAGNRRQRRETRARVTDRIKLMLERFQQLEYLDMRWPPLCDVPACMPALHQMHNLRKLWLIDTQSVRGLDDDEDRMEGQWRDEWTVGTTPAFPHLVELNLSSLGVEEECMLSIMANAPTLLDVSMLYSHEVTLASLFALSHHCPELRFLDVDGCVNLALTAEGWELGHEKYVQWLAKQPNLTTASSSQSTSSFSLSSSLSSASLSAPSLPFVSTTLTFPSLQFLYLTLSYDTDTDFVNLDTHGLTRFVDALSSSPLTHANISSEHLTSKHVALFEQWSALHSLNIATTGYGSQPRMAKTMLDYDGKTIDEDGQQQQQQQDNDDDDDEEGDEDEDDEDEDEEGDEEEAENENDKEEKAADEEKSAVDVEQSTGKKEKTDEERKVAVSEKKKKQKKQKSRKDEAAADTAKRGGAGSDTTAEKEKKEAPQAVNEDAVFIDASSALLSPSSTLSTLSSSEPDVDHLHIYTRLARRSALEQSAYDRSVTTHSHLHTSPRTQLDLHMLRYEGSEGDETGALVFSRTFRDEPVHDGMTGREAYFHDLSQHLGRDRKRSESELWSVRGRGRGRRRRFRGGRGGFGFGGR